MKIFIKNSYVTKLNEMEHIIYYVNLKELRSGKFTIMEKYDIIKSLVKNSSLVAHKERSLFDTPKEKGQEVQNGYCKRNF